MGGRGSWSKNGGVYEPNPKGGSGAGDDEKVLGPRIPETLKEALGEQGKPMTMMEAAKGTNPHFNQNFDAYSSNCQRCVLTYEARRRGYDVTALPTYSGDLLPYGSDYLKALSNPKVVDVGKSVNKLRSQMKDYGDGARAIIRVRKGSNGHVFIAENTHGKITYVDPQTNTRATSLSLRNVSNAAVIRLDNQQFTEYARNAFTRQKV
jgi:hypothetical protein